MKEYIKKFATPAAADGFEVFDKPFISAVESTGQTVHVDDDVFEMDDLTLAEENGNVITKRIYPAFHTAYWFETKTRKSVDNNSTVINKGFKDADVIKLGGNYSVIRNGLFNQGVGNTNKYSAKVLIIPSSVTSVESSTGSTTSPLRGFTNLEKVIWDSDYTFRVDREYNSGVHYGITNAFYSLDYANILFVLGKNVGRLGNNSLLGTYIQHLILHDDITLGEGVFRESNLKTIKLPSKLKSIPNDCFRDCSSLEFITIPDSVTSIGTSAFSGCTKLPEVTIPDNVTSIGSNAFDSGVINVNYKGTAAGAPWGAKAVNGVWEGGLLFDSAKTTLYYCKPSVEGEASIPDSVTTIGSNAFSGCTGLTSIEVPDSVTTIGNSAFASCSNALKVIIDELKISYTNKLYQSSSPSIAQSFNTFNIQFNSVAQDTFAGSYNVADSLFVVGGQKQTLTYNIYTDDQTVHDQMAAFATDQYTIVNLYHLDGTAWA